ncbi:hypothetical protein KQX54_018989 [Cotesia glomerata]|uniref:Uncharacterized protein n=1 Tax=Cotesia glomerata TaxID=32391 RepID=A0AAV7I7U3_COTGL|nr:hypothetical protein KQX54_018989 [Cotesia glomerata]
MLEEAEEDERVLLWVAAGGWELQAEVVRDGFGFHCARGKKRKKGVGVGVGVGGWQWVKRSSPRGGSKADGVPASKGRRESTQRVTTGNSPSPPVSSEAQSIKYSKKPARIRAVLLPPVRARQYPTTLYSILILMEATNVLRLAVNTFPTGASFQKKHQVLFAVTGLLSWTLEDSREDLSSWS